MLRALRANSVSSTILSKSAIVHDYSSFTWLGETGSTGWHTGLVVKKLITQYMPENSLFCIVL